MVTVLGHRGYLGRVVERRWREKGWDGDYVVCTFDDLPLIRRLAGPGVIVPSTDAVAEDTAYAATKREIEAIGRRLNAVVIRAGIIDLRKDNSFGNWFCNPLTPLEWADLAWEKRDQPGVHIAGRETVTRAMIGGGCPLFPEVGSNRVQPQDRPRPPLRQALTEWAEWSRS